MGKKTTIICTENDNSTNLDTFSFVLCRVQCGPLSEFSDRKHQCTLCGVKIVWHAQNIGQHLNSAHKISLKEYYYTYIKGQPIAAKTSNDFSIKPHSKFYTFIVCHQKF